MLPIYIVSRAGERMTTPRLLGDEGLQSFVVVDDSVQAKFVRENARLATPLVCPVSGIVEKRNWITAYHRQHQAEFGTSFYIGMDDNIKEFTAVAPDWYDRIAPVDNGTNWRPIFNKTAGVKFYISELNRMAKEMKDMDAPYGGVATMENPFFRAKKWSFRRFVKTKVFVMDASAKLEFKHTMCHDSYMTALAIARYGHVCVNNYLFYRADWYQKGGLGDRKAREAAGLLDQLNDCCAEFPGLVALARGKNSALRVCKVTDSSVDKWRREHGYL